MKPLSESTLSLRIAGFGLFCALIVDIIGFSTHSWMTYRNWLLNLNSGLWSGCSSGYCVPLKWNPAWLDKVRVLECIGLVGLILSTAATLANLFCITNRTVKRIVTFVAPLSGILIIAGCIYYASMALDPYSPYDGLGYSFAFTAAAGSIAKVTTIFLFLDARAPGNSPDNATTSAYPRGAYAGQVLNPPACQPAQYWPSGPAQGHAQSQQQ